MRSARSVFRFLPAALAILSGLALAVPAAKADILNVTPAPPQVQVAVPNGSTVTINWRVRRGNTAGTAVATILSRFGTFMIGGTPVGTVNRTLTRRNNTPPPSQTVEVITETLLVPRNVAFQMAKNPNLAATYSRTFEDGTLVKATGTVRLIPSTDTGAELGIRRFDLYFEDRSRVKVVSGEERLFALAELQFTGAGVALMEWQIAESAATKGAPIFRRLQVFRRSLSGRGRVIVKSPALPTRSQGLHLVRLVITEPRLAFEAPNLQYFVVPREGAAGVAPGQRIGLLQPPQGALLTAETAFSWQPTPGAAAYQLELYDTRSGAPVSPGLTRPIGDNPPFDPNERGVRPVAGVALPSDENVVSLKAFSLARLTPGRTYFWRVVSIANTGRVIAVSPLRPISTPQ